MEEEGEKEEIVEDTLDRSALYLNVFVPSCSPLLFLFLLSLRHAKGVEKREGERQGEESKELWSQVEGEREERRASF